MAELTNRGSKICVKPYSAKLLSAFENEKITMSAKEIILQVLSRGNEHISLNSVNVTWKLQILASIHPFKRLVGGTLGSRGKVDVNCGIFKLCTIKETTCNSTGIQRIL